MEMPARRASATRPMCWPTFPGMYLPNCVDARMARQVRRRCGWPKARSCHDQAIALVATDAPNRTISRTSPVRFVSRDQRDRSEEHTSELQSLMRTSYAVFCLKKIKQTQEKVRQHNHLRNTESTRKQQKNKDTQERI